VADANAAWIEGSGDADPADPGESTWNNLAHPSTAWTGGAGGGASIATLVDTVTITNPSTVSVGDTLTFTLSGTELDKLETWAAGGTNAGFLLKTTEGTAQNAIRVGSSENSTASYRPSLDVTYTVIPEPSSLALLGLGLLGMACGWQRRHK